MGSFASGSVYECAEESSREIHPIRGFQYDFVSIQSILNLLTRRLGTLPTKKTKGEFRYQDLTAVEIARELGYSDLWEILTPVIRHFVPARILMNLEQKFHELIHAELAGFAHLKYLRLPQLVVLTELENPQMWFPIQPPSQHRRVRHPSAHSLKQTTDCDLGIFVSSGWSRTGGSKYWEEPSAVQTTLPRISNRMGCDT